MEDVSVWRGRRLWRKWRWPRANSDFKFILHHVELTIWLRRGTHNKEDYKNLESNWELDNKKKLFFLHPAEVLFAPYFLSPRLVGDKFSRY